MKFDLFDMHCHLGFCNDAARAACELAAEGVGAFSNTVTPAEFVAQRAAFAGVGNMCVGVGLHPWWVGELNVGMAAAGDLELLCELVAWHRFVGEVGLDFSPRHVATREAQLQAFEAVAATCACVGGKVLSIHAVHTVDEVLDVLERTGALAPAAQNACIIHWFSGTSNQLMRARHAGCYFSVNPRMLQTKRGRAYAQAIPANRLLLETDLPAQPGVPWNAAHVRQQLEEALQHLATLRGKNPGDLREHIAETSRRLLQASAA